MEYQTLFREVDVVFLYDALSSTLIAIENNAKKVSCVYSAQALITDTIGNN